MLRLKKQAEEAKKVIEDSKTESESSATVASVASVPAVVEGQEPINLIGIGGKKIEKAKGGIGKKRSPGEIRIQTDITHLDAGKVALVEFPNPNDLTNFLVTIAPEDGFWRGGRYPFSFSIPPSYPHDPPKILCNTKIFHPNIDLQGKVCLNILREDWKPICDINQVIFGLISLFSECVNANDPLNHKAAELLRNDKSQFERVVRRTMQGYSHDGESYVKLI